MSMELIAKPMTGRDQPREDTIKHRVCQMVELTPLSPLHTECREKLGRRTGDLLHVYKGNDGVWRNLNLNEKTAEPINCKICRVSSQG